MIPAIATILAVIAVKWILAYHRANGYAWTAALAAGAAFLTWFTSVPLGWIGAAWAGVALFGAFAIVKPMPHIPVPMRFMPSRPGTRKST